MAVTLPVMMLVYEVIWHPPTWSVRSLLSWVRSAALPLFTTGLLTAIYIVSKSVGPEALFKNPEYHMTISLRVFIESQARFFKELFYIKPDGWFNEQWMVIAWLLLAYIA